MINAYDYDSYGNFEAQSETLAQPYAFTGREYDPESGLLYYRARYYDPATGRFISEDPIGFNAGDSNIYRYAFGDPVNLVDPFGLAATAGDAAVRQQAVANAAEAAFIGVAQRCLFSTVASGLGLAVAIATGLLPRSVNITAIPCLLIPDRLFATSSEGAPGGESSGSGDSSDTTNSGDSGREGANQPVPAPTDLPAFPNAKPAKPKTPVQGGGKKRERWKDKKGRIYEWDSRHGTVEIYDKRGKKHKGDFDPNTGEPIGPSKPGQTVEP